MRLPLQAKGLTMLRPYDGPYDLDQYAQACNRFVSASLRVKLATVVHNVLHDHVVYYRANTNKTRRMWVCPASMVLCNCLVFVSDLAYLTQGHFWSWAAHKVWDKHYMQWQGRIANGYLQDTDGVSMLAIH